MENNTPYSDETLWAKWLSGELNENEKENLSPEETQFLTRLQQATEELEMPVWNEAAAWQKIQEKIASKSVSHESTTSIKPLFYKSWIGWGIAAAACILIALGIRIFWSTPQPIEVSTQFGEVKYIYFPDSSMAVLNAGSRLSYFPDQWKQERSTVLEGEAYFEVKKGANFTVSTNEATIKVLGTSFNIDAYDVQTQTLCFSGKVRVSSAYANQSIVLNPGKGIAVGKDTWETYGVDNQNIEPDWVNGKYTYQNAKFVEVLEDFQRQFDTQVNLSVELQTLDTYTGYFFKDDLEEALKMICEPMNLTYTVDSNNVVRIYPKMPEQME